MSLPPPFSIIDAHPFNERLQKFRDSLGFSKADLAAELGVSPTTLYRWETGSTRPSPLAADKLGAMGFGVVAPGETNITTIPRLKNRATKKDAKAGAAKLRDEGMIVLGKPDTCVTVLPAPFVRNGPPDQAAFHRRLLDLQINSTLPVSELHRRLSMVEEVEGLGRTSQYLLEKPRPVAVSWNSNYGTHGWHRYVGRFPSHVIRALLNHFGADSSSVVCDPFAGSGTTAVECRLLGIPFVGIEICPLSAMITRTKAAFPNDPKSILAITREFISFYNTAWETFAGKRDIGRISHGAILEREGNSIPSFANVERWFSKEALLGTSIAVEFGMKQEGFAREAVLVALSAKMRSIGNVDVDVVRAEYRNTPRTNVDVEKLVARQLTKMAGDISASLISHPDLIGSGQDITVHEGSVLDIDLGEGSVSYIITSPPYGIEAISYLRTHLLSYRSLIAHLGHDPYDTREKTIGSEYLVETEKDAGIRSTAHSQTCWTFFEKNQQDENAKYSQRRAAMMQFCDDMLTVGERMARWLKPGGQLAFVIGNKRLGDEVIPMETIVTELFTTCGLLLTDTIRHKLKTNNSNSQVPWQEKTIQEECIMLFRKARNMRWSEGHIHLYMRTFLKGQGWQLIAGEYPGGSDHELYPLNVVDPTVARDDSPDPRRHSLGELIPDIVALQGRNLLIGEAKPRYDDGDRAKLNRLLTDRRSNLLTTLRTFALERRIPELLPVETLEIHPVLVFRSDSDAPRLPPSFSYLRIVNTREAYFEGVLGGTA